MLEFRVTVGGRGVSEHVDGGLWLQHLFAYLWLVGNGGMGHNYNYYYYHSSIPY